MKALLITIFIILSCSWKAYAYLDPGTGSFVLQILLAGLIGVLFTIKLFWKKIKCVITRLFHRKDKIEE